CDLSWVYFNTQTHSAPSKPQRPQRTGPRICLWVAPSVIIPRRVRHKTIGERTRIIITLTIVVFWYHPKPHQVGIGVVTNFSHLDGITARPFKHGLPSLRILALAVPCSQLRGNLSALGRDPTGGLVIVDAIRGSHLC